jgi:hypothetical protein
MTSPIKDNPLRNPGESLDEEINELIQGKLMEYFLVLAMAGALTFVEVFLWVLEIPRNPYIYPIFFLVCLLIYIPKIIRLKGQLKKLRQGRDGEKAVGQYLELLRQKKAKVFHDIRGETFNLDHVVIAPSGIYVIETKTYSKPESGRPRIIFDGEKVKVGNKYETDKPIVQVQAASTWLQSLIKESTGIKFDVKPVVVFPGWFVEPTSEAKRSDIWVLNPKALPTFIENSMVTLSDDELNMAAFHLSRYIRSYEPVNDKK